MPLTSNTFHPGPHSAAGLSRRALVALLQEHDLLAERQVNFEIGGEQRRLAGFKLVDEEKFAKLPDDVLLKFAKNGAMALIHHHLQSLGNLQVMTQMMRDQATKKP